jgi:serine/threonine protein kinase
VVHCDVKPGNVMMDRGGGIFLTDFGIARHAESSNTTVGVAGTPVYMAPEQIRGEPVSPATDIYALGVVLFEMLTGQRPFRGNESGTEKGGTTANERIRYGHLNLPAPDPCSLNPDLPVGLSTVLLMSLNKQPKERFRSTQEFYELVCAAAGRRNSLISDRMAPGVDQERELIHLSEAAAPGKPGGSRTPEKSGRVPWGLTLILLVVSTFLGSAAGFIYLTRGHLAPAVPTIAPTIPIIPPTNTFIPTNTLLPTETPTIPPTPTITTSPTFTRTPETITATIRPSSVLIMNIDNRLDDTVLADFGTFHSSGSNWTLPPDKLSTFQVTLYYGTYYLTLYNQGIDFEHFYRQYEIRFSGPQTLDVTFP